MKTLRILIAAALFMAPLCLGAQTKAETSLFGKTMNKPSVKAADKFLKKYPNSVYAPKVLQIKDSLLTLEFIKGNVSLISHESAMAVAGGAMDATGWKKDGKEHVIALDPDMSIRILSPDGSLEDTRVLSVYTMEEAAWKPTLVQGLEVIRPLSPKRNYIHFAYRNGESEWVEALYIPEEDLLSQAIFYGNPMSEGRIEGQSPEMMEGVTSTAEIAWLAGRLRDNPLLVQISKADILTDQAIQWWLQKNPKAQTSASKLSFGILDEQSSMVEACKKARKEKGKGLSAAIFDIRGYTVVCTVSKGEYKLIWCEPVCRNRKTDQYIRSMYFDNDGTTLNLFYYKGNTTFKKKISLPSQSLRHLK